MIWIIGGTKDSRDFLESISKKRRDIVVSTATAYGGKLLEGLEVEIHTKAMNFFEMKEFVKKFSVTCIVDMSHPYAYEVSRNAIQVADRKSTRLNSSHANISYAVFCLKKKNHAV